MHLKIKIKTVHQSNIASSREVMLPAASSSLSYTANISIYSSKYDIRTKSVLRVLSYTTYDHHY